VAPVKKNQPLGRLVVELDGETLQEAPLVALRSVEEGGLFHNMLDSLLMVFE